MGTISWTTVELKIFIPLNGGSGVQHLTMEFHKTLHKTHMKCVRLKRICVNIFAAISEGIRQHFSL